MTQPVNKQRLAQAFGRAAQSYNHHSELQRLCGERLMGLLPDQFSGTVLDAGCGTGWFSQHWRKSGHHVIALDLSAAMIRHAQSVMAASDYLIGDIESLPLASHSVDWCWSNLAIQWCHDPAKALTQLCRVTRPGGVVLFSTLIPPSLQEVGEAWQTIDHYPHANQFHTPEMIDAACTGRTVAFQQQTITLGFHSALDAMRSLKGIGATTLGEARRQGLLTPGKLKQLETIWRRDERGYLLSYHLLLGAISV